MNFVCRPAIGIAVMLIATIASAQPPAPTDLAAMSLEDLLAVKVVSAASKFPQEIREAPASVTVITADEIRRYGHRTLADTLRSVRGFYTTYDRNYSYVGTRGFARPGDYNTRVLLLIDGQRLNDPIYDMAPIGTDFPIDVSLIDRVEVIRGPGSALYGTNAFFAVINVVTRTGAQVKGLRTEAAGGSLGTRGGTVSFGKPFGNGNEMMFGTSVNRADGAARLYYPEFDTGTLGSGVATGLDHDESSNVFGSAALGRFSVRGGAMTRSKQVPTAAFDTLFADGRLSLTDNRAFVNAAYEGSAGRGWLATARVAYDYYGYEGFYPYDYGESEPFLYVDVAQSHTASGELTVRRRIARTHLVTLGTEVRHQFVNHMSAEDITVDIDRPGTVLGAYVQDEVRVFPWLLLSGGVRVDRYPGFGSYATPRAGAVILPRTQTAIKLLHGRAFRAPNPYERYYYDAMKDRTLDPERLRNTEVVWEETVSSRVRTAVTAFRYFADDIIELAAAESEVGLDLYFRNAGAVKGAGIEGEIEVKLLRGFSSRFSHAYASTTDVVSGNRASNSPGNLSRLGLQIPVSRLFLSVEGQYVGERLTLGGETLDGFFTPNITLTSASDRRIGFTVGVNNLFNHAYSDPGGEEHRQQSIRQDGRTVLARVRVAF